MRNANLKAIIAQNLSLLNGTGVTFDQVQNAKQSVARHFVRRKVSLAGTNKLVDSTVDKQSGVTSLNKGQLTGKEIFLVTGIGLRYAYHASDANVYGKRFTNNIYDVLDVAADATDMDANAAGAQSSPVAVQFVPQNLLDAQFKLIVGGEIKTEFQSSDFFVENTIQDKVRSHEDYFVSLGASPIIIMPNKVIDGELEFNPNLSAPANNHFVEMVLDGVYLF